ncbi:MAG: hypothetical protein OES25_02120 [Acidobacteriota bacterium]|nr:hypothetical protein [Acidobacteriota bacterium]
MVDPPGLDAVGAATTLLPGFRWVIVEAILAAADAWVLRRSVKAV